MTSTERTPLLPEANWSRSGPKAVESSTRTSPEHPDARVSPNLQEQARELIVQLRSSARGSPELSHDEPELAISLYTLYLLRPRSSNATNPRSVRDRLRKDGSDRKIRDLLYERIEKLLDSYEEAEDGNGLDDEEERLRKVFWGKHRVDVKGRERWVHAVDLMLPPYAPRSRPSPFLSHPVVRHMLAHTWSYGLISSESAVEEGPTPKSYLSRLMTRIGQQTTPSRLHSLRLLSCLVLYGLSLSIALAPGHWISPYTSDSQAGQSQPMVASKEVMWMIWVFSDMVHSFQNHYPLPLIQKLFLIPIYLAALLALVPPLRHLSYPLINISIPPLTFLLVLPHPPSIPVLLKGLIPPSVLLQRVLNRSIRTAGLLMPLVLVLFVIFGWSMNGDVFRGFWQVPVYSNFKRYDNDSDHFLFHDFHPHAYTRTVVDEPIEEGISPFSARVSLFSTLSLLFLFSIILTAARAIMMSKDGWDDPNTGARRWKGGVLDGDHWEREYGLVVGRQARGVWAEAVRRYAILDIVDFDEFYGAKIRDIETPAEPPNEQRTIDPSEPSTISKPDIRSPPPHTPPSTSIANILPPPLNLLTLPFDVILGCIPARTAEGLAPQLSSLLLKLQILVAGILCLPLMLLGRTLPAISGSAEDL
ncbi:hypothetical protein IAU59_002614 [Kwoniella sp. CBS 9459]